MTSPEIKGEIFIDSLIIEASGGDEKTTGSDISDDAGSLPAADKHQRQLFHLLPKLLGLLGEMAPPTVGSKHVFPETRSDQWRGQMMSESADLRPLHAIS